MRILLVGLDPTDATIRQTLLASDALAHLLQLSLIIRPGQMHRLWMLGLLLIAFILKLFVVVSVTLLVRRDHSCLIGTLIGVVFLFLILTVLVFFQFIQRRG
mmetsp:Transcript_32586/g.40384  ORF Transcript_32586/g.40384 Transcript_32586/m.40384 type:complete len:102 (-) Transcript_32586:1292-1597(-)